MVVRRLSALKHRVITAAQNPIDFIQDFREARKNQRIDLGLQKNKNQSEMELLTSALVIVLLTTASAKPIGRHRHYDADITDNERLREWLVRNNWWSWRSAESSSHEDSSQESDQSLTSWESSKSSESQSSEESSEEVLITDQTTPVMTTADMATTTSGDGMLTPEPDTMSTDDPILIVTPPPATRITPVVTSPGDVTCCVTEVIPTAPPITENRGDN